MKIVVLDFESYYDRISYTLSKMTTEAYIRDPRFEALCVSVVSEGKGVAVPQEQLPAFFASQDWSKIAVCAHHAQFDGLILSHVYGVKPAFWFDTISMARTIYGPHQRLSLAKLLEKFGLAGKNINYQEFEGKRWHEMSNSTRNMLMDGCVHDSIQTEKILKIMLPLIAKSELVTIDRTVRLFTEPHLVGNIPMLREIINEEVNRKADLLSELRVTKKDLSSNVIFSQLLESYGVEIEMKVTKTIDKKTGELRQAPAFAKTDDFMQELLDHEHHVVRGLAEARLDIKSTINETRAGSFLRMAERGSMCAYIHHAKAHTLRTGGGDRTNFQNLKRGSQLRKSLCAPADHLLSIKDFSQIELRTMLWLAGQTNKLQMLADGVDLYSDMAGSIYGKAINKKEHPAERQAGKKVVLSAIYGTGWEKLQWTCRTDPDFPIDLDDGVAQTAIQTFRKVEYRKVTQLWKEAGKVMERLHHGEEFEWKCFTIRDKKVYSPTGAYMHFDHLEQVDERNWRMEVKPGKWIYIWGGQFAQNLNQFLARCIAMAKVNECPRGIPFVLFSHDELGHVMHKSVAARQHQALLEIMCTPMSWAPDLPLAAEGGLSEIYNK